MTRILSHHFRQEYPLEAARIEALAARAPASRATLLAHALAAALHDARSELGRIDSRTLVLAGERDHLLGPTAGLDLTTGIRGASRVVIAGAGHDLTLERPSETAERVLELVAGRG